MNGDIEGAVRVAKAAKAFSWTWADEDVERFRSVVGWEFLGRNRESYSLATDLDVNIPHADVSCDGFLLRKYGGDRESILQISVYVTDIAKDQVEHLRQLFDQFSAQLTRELGEPDEKIAGEKIEWSTPSGIIALMGGAMSIHLEVVNPRYRKWGR
ncbi:DUF6301 family protein [Nocardia sp. NPDC058114]|uniref:DUF6301 family protein n=1 Tax=Nocardia sp. NPDC058114 TaxID=3346346 RepID=UPI0036DE35E6